MLSPKKHFGSGNNRHNFFIAAAQCVISYFEESKYHKERQNQKTTSCYKGH